MKRTVWREMIFRKVSNISGLDYGDEGEYEATYLTTSRRKNH